LRDWETTQPHMCVFGTVGIGKSAVLQLSVLRSLLAGEAVALYRDGDGLILLQLASQDMLCIERGLDVVDLGEGGRPPLNDLVVCFHSQKGFADTFARVNDGVASVFRRVLVVHSPSGELSNTGNAGVQLRLMLPPNRDELIAMGALHGVDENELLERVRTFGPTFRSVTERGMSGTIRRGIDQLVLSGVNRLKCVWMAVPQVHDLMLLRPVPDENRWGEMFSFASTTICDEAVRRLMNVSSDAVLRFANTTDERGSLCEQVFQNRMMCAISRHVVVQFRTCAGVKKTVSFVGGADSSNADLTSDLLFRPSNKNNAIDAFFLDRHCKTVNLLCMTVSAAPLVERASLDNVEQLLRSQGFTGSVQLVFLLPPVLFESFQIPQQAVGKRWMKRQAKWCIEMLDGFTFWPE
jgi:hypothetical protein